jgi:hypothetical protein
VHAIPDLPNGCGSMFISHSMPIELFVLTIETVLMGLSHVQALDSRSSPLATDWLQPRVESSQCNICAAVYS